MRKLFFAALLCASSCFCYAQTYVCDYPDRDSAQFANNACKMHLTFELQNAN